MLKRAGLTLKDLTVVDFAAASMETAIKSTGIDAGLVPAPYSTQMEQHEVTVPMGAPPPGSTWSGLLFGPKVGASAGARFLQALMRAARDLQGAGRTSDDTVAIMAKYAGVPADVLKSVPPYDWDPRMRPDTATVTAMQAAYRELGLLTYQPDLPAARCVDTSFSRRAASAAH
jgi:NitT/TauT family transport system substrate-binding protein